MSVTGMLLLAFLAASRTAQESRTPVPDSAAQKEAQKTIRDIFKQEYSKRLPADRLALARKLEEQAQQTKDDPTSQYVLWAEARDLYLELGDVESAFAVITRMEALFAFDGIPARTAALTTASKTAKTPEEMASLTRGHLKLVDDAIAAEDYAAAAKAADQALYLSKKSKELPLIARAQARMKDVADLRTKFDRVRKARETLAQNPEDAAANGILGRFECFSRGNWTAGLPLLAKGGDDLAAVATTDLSSPATPAEQSALGDSWWALGEPEGVPARAHLRDRASVWYEKAFPRLTGLTKAKVEQRLGASRLDRLTRGDWLDITDPSLFGLKGKPGDSVDVVTSKGTGANVFLKNFPKGEFDGLMVRAHVPRGCFGLVVFERDAYAVWLDGRLQECHVSRKAGPGGGWNPIIAAKVASLEDCLVTVIVSGGSYIVHLDGKEVHRLRTDATQIVGFNLDANEGTIKFDQIRLRRRK